MPSDDDPRMAAVLADVDRELAGWGLWQAIGPETRSALVGTVVGIWERSEPHPSTCGEGHCLYCCPCDRCSIDRARAFRG